MKGTRSARQRGGLPFALCVLAAACGTDRGPSDPTAVDMALVERGRTLFDDLRCGACHEGDGEAWEAAPLQGVGNRVRPQWMRSFLEAPARAHPGTSMPDALAGLSDGERAEIAGDLVHFLYALDRETPIEQRGATAVALETGRQLYHSIGCVACHDPFELAADLEDPLWSFQGGWTGEVELPERTERSLSHVAAKTHASTLAEQLLDPEATWPDGRMPSLSLTPGEALQIATFLTTPEVHEGRLDLEERPGLQFEYFEASLDDEPETYDRLVPVREGVADELDELPEHRGEQFGFRYTGFVTTPESGSYTFWTTSDDGSRLWIDGELVVDNGGDHGMSEQEGSVHLEAGRHALTITYYEHGGDEGLEVAWAGPGRPRAVLAAPALSHWVLPEADEEPRFAVDADRASRGRGHFERFRCGACHPLQGLNVPGARNRDDLNARRGCLSETPRSFAPDYSLDEESRAALAAFVRHPIATGDAADPTATVRRTMARLDCHACHARDGVGGPATDRLAYFRVHDDLDLGDEGRIPPHLDGVGAKLTPEALEGVLLGDERVRPYLQTRMPVYASRHVERLVSGFVDADARPGDPAPTDGDIETGRELAGASALGCIQCHDLGEYESIGIPAVNLVTMADRIRPSWFRRLMLDPQSVGMSSRMPSFWKDGKSPVEDVLGADPEAQTAAVWAWLSVGESMPLPDGLVVPDEDFELYPVTRPVQCAVFMEGVGPRTLVVGFPERLHYAFDLERSRLAKIWRGRFFNARGTWYARAGVLQSPPVEDVLELPAGAPFALLASPDAPWPTQLDDRPDVLGRRLDEQGRPSFRYAVGDVEVEELPVPRIAEGGGRLARSFRIAGRDSAVDALVMRVAVGRSVTRAAKETWIADGATFALRGVDDEWTRLRRWGDEVELLVELPAANALEIGVEVSW